jgi:hypothetical protein
MQQQNDLVFSISTIDLQNEALRILGRTLSEEEIDIAKDGLEAGLLTNIDVVYKTIFFEMI